MANGSYSDEYLINSRNPKITEVRKLGLRIIEKYNKPPYHPTKEDIDWFWRDHWSSAEEIPGQVPQIRDCKERDRLVNLYVKENREELEAKYPFDISGWCRSFKYWTVSAFLVSPEDVGKMDWIIYFTIIEPLPEVMWVPFWQFIQRLNQLQVPVVRKILVNQCFEDEEMRGRLIREEMVPGQYLWIMPYQKLREEVLKKVAKQRAKEAERRVEVV